MSPAGLRARLDPPLTPGGDQGRSELRRELLRPEYHRRDPVGEAIDWLERHLEGGVRAAHAAPPLSTLAAMLLLVALLVALALLVSRTRRTATTPGPDRAVLTGEVVTADQLLDRARAALAQDRFADAVLDGFRALTLRQVERGLLDDSPGATAHEVAGALGAALPAYAERLVVGAVWFDAVRYGGRAATADQAHQVLDLAQQLAGERRGALR